MSLIALNTRTTLRRGFTSPIYTTTFRTATANLISELTTNHHPVVNKQRYYSPSSHVTKKKTFTAWAPMTASHTHSQTSLKEEKIADHSWRQVNRIWSDEDLEEKMDSRTLKHVPVTLSDKIMSTFMKTLYVSFNTITGYQAKDPSPKSIEWRLIILESFAGVPGMLAAAFRHFYSLRTLQRDHGSIYTFLEEAENERMHLLVCLKMFNASTLTKALVVGAQLSMTPVLMLTYMISPAAMHRFVGYLEETAVETYGNIVEHCETEGTKLHKEWSTLDAPEIAKVYWSLEDNATWVTCLKHMLADEAHHRDVNHTFATLPEGSDNPFIQEHMQNFDRAAMRRMDTLLKDAMKKQGLELGQRKSSDKVLL